MPVVADLSLLSFKAQARLKRPKTRGAFNTHDAARRQLGLLTVADPEGQGRIYWLVDLATGVIEDARFLAFGDLVSHPIFDAFTELARGNTVAAACALTGEQIDSLLRDDPVTPATGSMEAYAAIRAVQDLAESTLPTVELLPPPTDTPRYQRKRKADWTPEDQAWLPLGLFKKAEIVEGILSEVLRERLPNEGVTWRLDGINDDFHVRIRFTGLDEAQIPTLCAFVQDALHGRVHPQLVVEEVR